MKKVRDLKYANPTTSSPSKQLQFLKNTNQENITTAKEAINELEVFLEQYKIYLAVLEKVQTVLDSEKIE